MVLTLFVFQPQLGLGSKEYEVTAAPEVSKPSYPELTSVRMQTIPVTLLPKLFPIEEEPRTDYVTDDKTTEGQGGQLATLAPRLVPETIEKPPGPGPLISVLITLIFLAIVIFIIQVRLIMMFCLTSLLTWSTFRLPKGLLAVLPGPLPSSTRAETRMSPSGTEPSTPLHRLLNVHFKLAGVCTANSDSREPGL